MRNLIQAFVAGLAGAVTVMVLIGATSIRSDESIETDEQLISNVLPGTAPLVIQSSDRVSNLNADMVDGMDASAFASAADTYTMAEVDALLATHRDSRLAFYLSALHDGSDADIACDSGFHFASLWEIMDPSNLRYDPVRGLTRADSGLGPPVGWDAWGWVRTGNVADVQNAAGEANCTSPVFLAPWTSNSTEHFGTVARLEPYLNGDRATYPQPWSLGSLMCWSQNGSWCVEDYPGAGGK